jgi:cyclase
MFRPRVIPVLLLQDQGLVKSVKFKKHRYIGDPINAVKIFNDLKADELVFLDISASKEKRCISFDFVRQIGDEANMPFSVGGGIKTIDQIRKIIHAGAEKVVINTAAVENPGFIKEASLEFGNSTIVVSIDVKHNRKGKAEVYKLSGRKSTGLDPVSFALNMQKMGAGEILLNSIDDDGMMTGYKLDLIRKVADEIEIPLVAVGGGKNYDHLRSAVKDGHASAVAAGSMFVYHGERKAILVNYPGKEELRNIFLNNMED